MDVIQKNEHQIETFAGQGAMEWWARGFPFAPHCIRRGLHFSTWEVGKSAAGGTGRDRMHLNRPKTHAKAFNKKKRLGFTFVGL